MSIVIKAQDFDETKLQVKDPEVKNGNTTGKITYDGHIQYLIQTEPLTAPFGLSIKPSPWDPKEKTASVALEMNDDSPTRAVVNAFADIILSTAQKKPKLFVKSTKADILEHAFSHPIKAPSKEGYSDLLYAKVWLSAKEVPQLFAIHEDATIDPTTICGHSTVVALLDMTSYWVKGAKEFGHGIYVKQIKVLEFGDMTRNQPLFVE